MTYRDVGGQYYPGNGRPVEQNGSVTVNEGRAYRGVVMDATAVRASVMFIVDQYF